MGSSSRYKNSNGKKESILEEKSQKAKTMQQQMLQTKGQLSKSASAQKLNVLLKSTDDSTPPVTVPPATVSECNFIINSELFLSTITIIESSCLYQNLSTVIEHSISEKKGLAQFFNIYCNDCDWNQKFCSSKECNRDSNSSGRNGFDLNKRAPVAFHEIGQQGYAAITMFCWCMNMPPLMAQTTFDN